MKIPTPQAIIYTRAVFEGSDPNAEKPSEITADDFFKVEIKVVENSVQISGKNLVVNGKAISIRFTKNGEVH